MLLIEGLLIGKGIIDDIVVREVSAVTAYPLLQPSVARQHRVEEVIVHSIDIVNTSVSSELEAWDDRNFGKRISQHALVIVTTLRTVCAGNGGSPSPEKGCW